jgi:hypothetical protein
MKDAKSIFFVEFSHKPVKKTGSFTILPIVEG